MCPSYELHTIQTVDKKSVTFFRNYSCRKKKCQKRFYFAADSWPQVFDDSEARADWNWKPKYDLDALVDFMVKDVRDNYINGNGKRK